MSAHAQPLAVVNRVTQARRGVLTASVILFYFMSVLAVELAEMDEDGQAEQDGQVVESVAMVGRRAWRHLLSSWEQRYLRRQG